METLRVFSSLSNQTSYHTGRMGIHTGRMETLRTLYSFPISSLTNTHTGRMGAIRVVCSPYDALPFSTQHLPYGSYGCLTRGSYEPQNTPMLHPLGHHPYGSYGGHTRGSFTPETLHTFPSLDHHPFGSYGGHTRGIVYTSYTTQQYGKGSYGPYHTPYGSYDLFTHNIFSAESHMAVSCSIRAVWPLHFIFSPNSSFSEARTGFLTNKLGFTLTPNLYKLTLDSDNYYSS
jgi:hypothetical protein